MHNIYICICIYIYKYMNIYIKMYIVKFEILTWNIIGDFNEWITLANITIRSYLFHFSTIFLYTVMSPLPCSPKHPYLFFILTGRNCAQASRRVSVFRGHVHKRGLCTMPEICRYGYYKNLPNLNLPIFII